MSDDESPREPRVTVRGLARAAGVPPPPRLADGPLSVQAGEILPGSAANPERDAGLCACGRPARIDSELCGYCLPQTRENRLPDGQRWVNGKFANALAQSDLYADYQRARLDPNYLSMREYGAVLDAHLIELLKNLNNYHQSQYWTEAYRNYQVMRTAEANGDTTEERKARNRLEELFVMGERADRTWEQIHATMELRRKFVDTEAKNAERLQHMLSAQQANQLITTIVVVLKRKITDLELLNEIVEEIRKIAAGEGGERYDDIIIYSQGEREG